MDDSVKENYEQCAKCLTTTVIWTTQTVNRYYSALHMLVLVGILMAFSIIGGYVFQQIEATHERTNAEAILTKRGTVIDSATNKKDGAAQDKGSELTILQYEGNFIKAIQNGVVLYKGEAQTLWSFGGSVYFCMTTYTLLGYGNLAPKSNLGRVIAIVYSGFCIPIATLIIGDIGEIFLQMFEFTWRLIARWNYRRALRKEKNKAGNNIYSQRIRSCGMDGRLWPAHIDAMILQEEYLKLGSETSERNMESRFYENGEAVEIDAFRGHVGTLGDKILLLNTGRRQCTGQILSCDANEKRGRELPILSRIVLCVIGAALTLMGSVFQNLVATLACCRLFQRLINSSTPQGKDFLHSRSLSRDTAKNVTPIFVNRLLCGTNGKKNFDDPKYKIRRTSESNIYNVSSRLASPENFTFSGAYHTVYVKDIYDSNNLVHEAHSIALFSPGDACSTNVCASAHQKIHHAVNRNNSLENSQALKRSKGSDYMPPVREFLRSQLSQYFLASPLRWFFMIKMIRDRFSAHSERRRGVKGENKNNNSDIWEDPTMADFAMFGIDDTSKAAAEHADVPQSSVPILMTTIMGFVYIGGGSIALSLMSDQLSFFDCFWFMFISTLTVGYGDVVPADQELMIFFLLYIFICLSLMSNVINEISQFFNANVAKLRDIGHDAVGIIKARKEIEIKKEKSSQARKHWKIVRDRVKKGKIPKRLILESRMYKAKLLAEEREQVRWAFKIYFEYLCSLKQGKPAEVHHEEPAKEEAPEEAPAEEPTSPPSDESPTPEEVEEEGSETEIDVVPSEIPEPEEEEELILIVTEPEKPTDEDKKLTRWQRFKRYVKRVSKKGYQKTKALTKKAIEKIKNSKLAKLLKRKKKTDTEEKTEEVIPKKQPFYFA